MLATRLPSLVLVAVIASTCVAASGTVAVRPLPAQTSLAVREQQLWSLAVHASNFSPLARTVARTSCEAVQPPEALATPDPLLGAAGQTTKITVSFIIGTDGRVHSPLILQGLGPSEDRLVLDVVSSWRYRPATCNGVPTEAEGKIAFSSR
jgi:hypothetical protein